MTAISTSPRATAPADSDADLTGQTLDDLLGSVLRIDVDHPDPGRQLQRAEGQPVRRSPRRPSRDLGLRPAQPLAAELRPRVGPALGRQQRPGPLGADLPDPEGRQLRLEHRRGELTSSTPIASKAPTRSRRRPPSTPTARPARSPAAGSIAARNCPSWSAPTFTATGPPAASGGSSTMAGQKVWHHELVDTPFNITGFGADHDGELYVIDQQSGFYRLEPTTEADRPAHPFPTRLSETGLFASVADHRPHPAALPFEVVAPQWADGATMERFAALPGLERIEQHPQLNAGGAWSLPNGSVLVQTLSLDLADDAGKADRKRVETRLLVRQQGEWTGYSYRWNDEQTDAEVAPRRGRRRRVRGRRPERSGRPSGAVLAVPVPDRVPGLPLAGRRLHPGLHPAATRPRPRLRRHPRQSTPHLRTHRPVRGLVATKGRRPVPAGEPLRRECPDERRGSGRTCTSTARPATSRRAAATRTCN